MNNHFYKRKKAVGFYIVLKRGTSACQKEAYPSSSLSALLPRPKTGGALLNIGSFERKQYQSALCYSREGGKKPLFTTIFVYSIKHLGTQHV